MSGHNTEKDQCERPACDEAGLLYYPWQKVVSNHPIAWTGTALTPPPEQPIRLCHGHALDAFGVAFWPGTTDGGA